jgi:hypothetical protein
MTMNRVAVIACLLACFLAGCSSQNVIKANISPDEVEKSGYSTINHCIPVEDNAISFPEHFLSVNKRGQYLPIVFSGPPCGSDVTGKTFKMSQELPKCIGKAEGCSDSREDMNNIHDAFKEQINKTLDAVYSGKGLSQNKKYHLMMFIHGGLNDHEDSTQRGIEQMIAMRSFDTGKRTLPNGGSADQRYREDEVLYPLFINWPSGLFDAYFDKTFNYAQGQYDTSTQKIVGPLSFVGNIGEAIVRAPANYAKSIQRWRASLRSDYKSAANVWSCQAKGPLEGHLICSQEGDLENRITRWIPYGATFPARLITTPMIDPYGKAAWDGMLTRTRLAFYKPVKAHTPVDQEEYLKNGDLGDNYNIRTKGVLWHFFKELEERHQKSSGRVEITIVAHSMGAIIANEIVRVFPGLPYKNIVYMGAASSIRDFRISVEPLLQSGSHPNLRFYNLSLHPFAEVYEINRGGLSPLGSLLEWIDDIYTTPLTFEDRVLGKWLNVIMAANEFSNDALKKMTFKRFGLSECSPLRHTDFDLVGFPDCDSPRTYWDPAYWILEEKS